MRLDRLLAIIIIISQKGLVTGKELAEHFEVSLRTIYRDIDKIGEAGIPIAATGGNGGGYYIMENYNINNLFLNKKELEPLISVIDNLSVLFGHNTEFNDIILKFNTIRKSQEDEYNKLNIKMAHFSMEKELKESLSTINKAIDNNRLIEFDYINRRMELSKRIVEPINLQFDDGNWFVIGFCRIRNDYRKFKLVRTRNIKLGDYFQEREISKDKIEQIFTEGYEKNSILVTLMFSNKIGEQLSEYFYKDKICALEDGRFIVKEYFPDDEGLKKFILGFGEVCKVIAPDKLKYELKQYIKNIYDKYND
ncbi:helix-turn-helix transcriptional regulator [Clostridium paridis]|uniref:YafY family transcriptional regulator n=1 Tax=Clostridium paridis TaxID=2803863 RepID=A0A937FD56_9CLOT|nr:YafY family protein [Clostridium paridis]MBL4931674.1 YafY family transcriptional regulator [Clostridium paridis]